MDVKKQIKSLLNQAEVYKTQGLLDEGLSAFEQAGELIRQHAGLISNHEKLLEGLGRKIEALKEEIRRVEDAPLNQPMPDQVLDVIKRHFSFSQETERRSMDGAIALAKFGQFESALVEFRNLLSEETLRLEAGKNIVRCHIALGTFDDAVRQYEHWFNIRFFAADPLEQIRAFLQAALDKRGIDTRLPLPVAGPPEPGPRREITDDEMLDISSVSITLTEGPHAGKSQEFDVSFQAGSVLNLLISGHDREFLESIREGTLLDLVQFFSPIAMFDGKAVVMSKSEITSGPKQGHFSLDIKVKSI